MSFRLAVRFVSECTLSGETPADVRIGGCSLRALRRTAHAIVATLSVLLALSVAGCSAPPASPQLPESPCPIDSADEIVRAPSIYTNVARPYEGPGPHTLQASILRPPDGMPNAPIESFPGDNPDAYAFPDPKNPIGDTQLILCTYQRTGSPVDTCSILGSNGDGAAGTRTLLDTTYVYQLYEARTSRLVARFDVHGIRHCGGTVSGGPSGPPVVEQPDNYAANDRLRPYIYQTVP